MPNQFRSLDRITIAVPCNADWDSMIGNDQVRFCEHCQLHVNDLSAITRPQALRLVARSQGRLCVRYIQRPGGGVLTNAPEELYRIGRRVSRLAAGAFTATLSLSSATAQSRSETNQNTLRQVTTVAELTTLPEPGASLFGVITDPAGAVVPGAVLTLSNARSHAAFTYVTGDDGAYKFSLLEPGIYQMVVEARSFARTSVPELDLLPNASKTVNLEVGLPELIEEVEIRAMPTMGVVVFTEPEDPLVMAAFKDDLKAVAELALTSSDINASDKETNTNALAYAIHNHNRDMVNALLTAGADANAANRNGQTPLMYLSKGATVELVGDLISAGANVNSRDLTGDTALINAAGVCSFPVVKELIDASAKIDAADDHGNTALIRAAENEDAEILRFLIKAGVNVNAKNQDGESALTIAARSGKADGLKALIHGGAAINLKRKDLNNALAIATSNEDPSIVRILLDAGASANARDREGTTVLMLAAENGKPEMIKALIDAGAEINAVDNEGWTAMMHANEVENVRVLLNAGADMSIKNNDGQTALSLARKYEQEDVIKLLVSRGAPE